MEMKIFDFFFIRNRLIPFFTKKILLKWKFLDSINQ